MIFYKLTNIVFPNIESFSMSTHKEILNKKIKRDRLQRPLI